MRPVQFLFPDIDTFRHALESPAASWIVTAFLISVGCIYGLFVAAFQRIANGDLLSSLPVSDIPGYILYGGNVIAGILIVLAAHVGMTFIAWLMARAVGGPGHMTALYRTTAYLLPLFLPAVPFVAANAAAAALGVRAVNFPFQELHLPLAILAAGLVLNGLFVMFRTVQDLTPLRAGCATAGMVIFVWAILLIA